MIIRKKILIKKNMYEELLKYKKYFHHPRGLEYIQLRFPNLEELSEKMIKPFVYYKASEEVAEDIGGCISGFGVDVEFYFEGEDKTNLLEDLYTITYNPLNRELEIQSFNLGYYHEHSSILRQYFLANKNVVNHNYSFGII